MSGGTDTQVRFHEEWLGLAQPIQGLVFSVPVLASAQIAPEVGPDLSARFRGWLTEGDEAPFVQDLRAFFDGYLGYTTPGMLVGRGQLPDTLRFYADEGGQELRPSFAIGRGPFETQQDDLFGGLGAPDTRSEAAPEAKSPWLALVWDLRDDALAAGLGLSLDKPEDASGPWLYPPTYKLERLLRHTGVPVGFLSNGRELRLMYAPAGEATSHLTFRFADMNEAAGRPILAAFELLLSARRTYESAPENTFEGLLRRSRLHQADVTEDLAEQVFEAVEILLAGFEEAARRGTPNRVDWIRPALEEPDDHFYQGVLSVVLRLVFLLYAEDRGLLPVTNKTYTSHLSVQGLYEELMEDAGAHPESMHHRFGAYGRLLALFRGVFLGVRHDELVLPPRHGKLFDPSSYPFLEGGLPGSTSAIAQAEARAEVTPPAVDDGTIYRVLERLIVFERQRLSYRTLDVEQIGSVYESLMGYHVLRVETAAVRFGKHRVWTEVGALKRLKPAERKDWLKETCGLTGAQITRVETALKAHTEEEALAEALHELAPGRDGSKERHRTAAGTLVLQPGDERRRSGSHYTPRSLTTRIVKRTLEPLLACLGEKPNEQQVLSLKICDPAMGSGAFLVETCRQLADELEKVWRREGRLASVATEHGDPHLHACRLVAQRCVYGVDKNAAAVELAKLSLWLVTFSADLPFTFVDHALRHGDSLVGLDLEQVAGFHWKPTKQLGLFKAVLEDALDQALEHRQELHEMAVCEDANCQEDKRRLLDHASQATEKIRLVADVCVGAFFASAKDKEREKERDRRQGLVEQWLAGDESLEPELRDMANAIRKQHAPFHWWLEFPEVFYATRPDPLNGGKVEGATLMEGFVGNPPFAGKNTITNMAGKGYVDWLMAVRPEVVGRPNTDLCAYFFRRAADLVGSHGSLGLVATNTIAQGDSRLMALQPLVADRGAQIFDARRSFAWPGAAAVTVAVVHLAFGRAAAQDHSRSLDDVLVRTIDTRLRSRPERPEPVGLASNACLSFMGGKLVGIGLSVTLEEYGDLLRADPVNAAVLRPYLGGEEVNTSPTGKHDRYMIDFSNTSLDDARKYPILLKLIEEKVRPARERDNRGTYKTYWWRPGESAGALYSALGTMARCMVCANVSKHLCFSFQNTAQFFANTLYVFPLDTPTPFAVLQSRIHEPWARLLSSSMKTDLRYSASDCFAPFPFPISDPRTVIPAVEAAGQTFYDARARFMVETNQGLTKTYNALKDPACTDAAVLELRRLSEAMDRAVLDAYGWTDLAVPPYCALTQAEREAQTAFEDEVIDRLYVLNAERAREEERLGAGRSGAKKAAKKTRERKTASPVAEAQKRLFPEED